MSSEAVNRPDEQGQWQVSRNATPRTPQTPEHAAAQQAQPPTPTSPRREVPPGESPVTRLLAIKGATNPLLEAARPLLRAMGDHFLIVMKKR